MYKCTVSLLACLFVLQFGFAQDLASLKNYSFDSKSDYKKAEPLALECSKYMTTHPLSDTDLNWRYAVQFLIRWMEGTPDHHFMLDETAVKLSKNNSDLLGLYMACMTQFSIENPDSAKDANTLKLNSITSLLTYCEDPANNVKLDKELKNLIEAKNEGKLKERLKI